MEKWVREKRVAILTIWEVRMMTAVRERWKSRKAWEAVGRGGGKERVVQVQDARWPELPPDRFPPHKGSCPIWVTSACTIPPHHLLPDLPSTPILADRGAFYNVGCYVTFSLPSSPHAGWCHLRVFGITRLEQPLHGTWSVWYKQVGILYDEVSKILTHHRLILKSPAIFHFSLVFTIWQKAGK